MNKRRAVFLVLGIILGLLVTACAGIATSDGQVLSGPTLFGPSIDSLSLPVLEPAPAAEARPMQAVRMERVAEQAVEQAIEQAQQQMMLYGGDTCDRHHGVVQYDD